MAQLRQSISCIQCSIMQTGRFPEFHNYYYYYNCNYYFYCNYYTIIPHYHQKSQSHDHNSWEINFVATAGNEQACNNSEHNRSGMFVKYCSVITFSICSNPLLVQEGKGLDLKWTSLGIESKETLGFVQEGSANRF